MTLKKIGYWLAGIIVFVGVALGSAMVARTINRFDANQRTDNSTKKSNDFFQSVGQAYVWTDDVNTPTATAHVGKRLFVHNIYIRRDTCHIFLTRLWIDKERHISDHLPSVSNWLPPGTYEVSDYYEVPAQLPPGHWHIIKKAISFCAGQVSYTNNYDVEVDVVP